MAFNLDFSKLGQPRTAEQEQAEHAAYETARNAKITERQGMVEALMTTSGLHEREAVFVRDLDYMATSYDPIDAVLGGRLATLTERQLTWLTNLHQVYVVAPVTGPGRR
jgi:hypothetical protein